MDVEKILITQLLPQNADDNAIRRFIRENKGGVGGSFNRAFNVTVGPHPDLQGQYTATSYTIPTYDLVKNGFIVGSDGLKHVLSDGDKFQVVSDKPTMAASTDDGQDHFSYMLPVSIVGDGKDNLEVRYIIADNLTFAKKME